MKKWMIGGGILGALAVVLVAGSLMVMSAFAQGSTPPQADTGPNEQVPSYTSSIHVDEAQYEGRSETDEAKALAGLATITPEQAKDAALAANPGASVVKVELDNENGALVYSVELDSGLDVKVDAGNATVLHVEQADANEGAEVGADTDNVQEQFESQNQADDVTETPGIEDASGQ